MNDADVTKFDDYWRSITRNEEFIRQWGHNACQDWEGKWHQDLEDAYSQLRPLLEPVTKPRMFHRLPGDLNPFEAENYHHALTLILNPPERWFGNVGMLRSQEYLAMKRAVEEEEEVSYTAQLHSAMAATTKVATDPFEGLNETACDILHAMDRVQPRRWKEIAGQANYSEDKVRQYSTDLQEKQLIKKTPRGFIRLVPLPGECESQ